MPPATVLETRHLAKRFGAVHAVEDVSLSIRTGEIFGFLGPNGAGKTTTISMILGLTYPTAGTVTVFGQLVTPRDNHALRQVGALVGAPAVLLPLSARRNLQLLATLYPDLASYQVDTVLDRVGLADAARRPASGYSTGMKQRLGLALALLNNPRLLVLDEPANGLDPAGIHEMRLLLRSLAERGTTIFLSSHLLHEVELLCDRVAVVKRGRIIAEGAVSELLRRSADHVTVVTADPERTAAILRELPGAGAITVLPDRVEVRGLSSEVIMYNLVNAGITPREVSVARPDLEAIFLELTGDDA
jgi:ABC-2 type transport system ATP-binding protein